MKIDYLAVVAGFAAGIGVALLSRLLLGQDAAVIGGSLAVCAVIASAVTRARQLST
jgi:uncharacterized membrane protein YgaE (UPF0421/DUF939 family)